MTSARSFLIIRCPGRVQPDLAPLLQGCPQIVLAHSKMHKCALFHGAAQPRHGALPSASTAPHISGIRDGAGRVSGRDNHWNEKLR